VAVAAHARWGVCASVSEIGEAEGINRSYVCRVLRLTLLAPDIVERILAGQRTVDLGHFLKPFPLEWERQREWFF
jgi:hypothetical protein